MRSKGEVCEWLIAVIDPVSLLRLLTAEELTQDMLRSTIKHKMNTLRGKVDHGWEKEVQREVMQLDDDLVQFFVEKGFIDKETLMEKDEKDDDVFNITI
jgi:hypothetical protein